MIGRSASICRTIVLRAAPEFILRLNIRQYSEGKKYCPGGQPSDPRQAEYICTAARSGRCPASTPELAIKDPALPLNSHVLGQGSVRSTYIPSAGKQTCIIYILTFCVPFVNTLLAGQKHLRDPWSELDESGDTLPNPFLDNNTYESDDDGQLGAAEEDENNGQDFLLPDKVEREFNFVGNLDGLELATGFKSFFAEVKKKTVYIEYMDEAL
ncbi:hypothetical protein DFQ28_009480 [Apophysomyces sp. BC1034]|nr:hypothetical protein DFQ28_009480 [Apophysomyces sp. BC1034]